MNIEIRQATHDDADWLYKSFEAEFNQNRPYNYFVECCDLQAKDELILLYAVNGSDYLGHLKVVWHPDYTYFRDNNIPEIQDLNVVGSARRQGVASRLMDVAEAHIKERSPVAGIGFGLFPAYGAAQVMYVRRGYVPDGRGIAYHGESVTEGQTVSVDKYLVLSMTRQL